MWDQLKRERFRHLRRREDEGALTPEEQNELALMIEEIENEEAAYLRPATERLDRELERIEARTRALATLARRREALVAQMEAMLSEPTP
jgi:hypothetical protein